MVAKSGCHEIQRLAMGANPPGPRLLLEYRRRSE